MASRYTVRQADLVSQRQLRVALLCARPVLCLRLSCGYDSAGGAVAGQAVDFDARQFRADGRARGIGFSARPADRLRGHRDRDADAFRDQHGYRCVSCPEIYCRDTTQR